MTASYTVMASEFPDKIATTFSLLETWYLKLSIIRPNRHNSVVISRI
jgi:hypothetical protein